MTILQLTFGLVLILSSMEPRFLQNTSAKGGVENAQPRIAGVWRGHSECSVKNSACHDEVNVYRFSRIAGQANAFSVTASKIVDDKEVVMGSSECKYDEKKRVLECEKPSVQLAVEGERMEGALRLADGTVYRRIYLKKEG